MGRLLVVVTLAAGTASADPATLHRALRKVAHETAQKLVRLGREAIREDQGATGNRILRRAVELHPNQPTAMRELGYTKEGGEYTRTHAMQSVVETRRDTSAAVVSGYRLRVERVESDRAIATLLMCEKYADAERARPILLRLLDHNPRLDSIHRALGHVAIGANYVRPELEGTVRGLRRRLRGWRGYRHALGRAEPTKHTLQIKGHDGRYPYFLVGMRYVTASASPERTRELAAGTEPPYAFMRHVLGRKYVYPQNRAVMFLKADAYRALVAAYEKDPAVRKRKLRYANYYGPDFEAIRSVSARLGPEIHAGNVAFDAMQALISPDDPDNPKGPRQIDVYAWVKEGFSNLVTFELHGRSRFYTVAETGSSGKLRSPYLKPTSDTLQAALAWMRGNLLHGVAYPLREVFGRRLNNLDQLATLQAWSFLRFLFLHDPDGARAFPEALRQQREGPPPERVDRALRQAFGQGTDALERLWRQFVLEIL